MNYSRQDVIDKFKDEVINFLPGAYCTNLELRSITNAEPLVFVNNKAQELFNVVDVKSAPKGVTYTNKTFVLDDYKKSSDVSYGTLIHKYLLIPKGRYNGAFYVNEDETIVELIVDLIYFLINGMTSEAYSLMNLIDTTLQNYQLENRFNYIKINTGSSIVKIKPLEM